MSTTKIAWAELVWNPVTGCTKVSAGCTKVSQGERRQLARMQIMARKILSGSPPLVKFWQSGLASTSTDKSSIRFIRLATFGMLPMIQKMMGIRWKYHKVLWAVVGLITIQMVNQFSFAQSTAQLLTSYYRMLVGITMRLP